MKYDEILDPEIRAFIAHTEDYYPPNTVDLTISEQRAIYDRLCRVFHQGYPDGVRARHAVANGIPVRVYESGEPSATVVYFHGGGFVVGGLESHDDICAEICAGAGSRVVSVDYRLAPEHVHPAAYDDSIAASHWSISKFDGPIVLAGDSAGGTLAASVVHALRHETDRIAGQVLIYPALGAGTDSGSSLDHANAPLLTRDDIIAYKAFRTGGREPANDWTYAALQDSDFSNLPPTIIVAAAIDPLADDGRVYRDLLRDAGCKAEWISEAGLVHGYLRARNMSSKARRSFDRIVADIRSLGNGIWPYG